MLLKEHAQSYDLLLHEQCGDDEARALLAPANFIDWRAAHNCLLRIAADADSSGAFVALLPHLLRALGDVASPDGVLVNFERFAHNVSDRVALFRHLAENPRAVEQLVTLFASSQFLAEILLRHPEYFERLTKLKSLAQVKSSGQYYVELQAAIPPAEEFRSQKDSRFTPSAPLRAGFHVSRGSDEDDVATLDALRRFQRWELLRIGACDLFDLFDLSTATRQLSNLAEALVQHCLTIAALQTGIKPNGFVVLALGKLGGGELNYSSDIDLLFLADADAARYMRLGERLIAVLTKATAEGFLYRVDMRLRPWGRTGPLVSTLDGHLAYLSDQARLWERQALLKAWPIAGDLGVGDEFLGRVEALPFDMTPAEVRADVRAMKQRTEAHLRRRGREWGEVKLGVGSIRDVEFVTQCLQLVHGATYSNVRSRNTLDALERLHAHGCLPADEFRVLLDGYIFLRTIEHHLQLMHYRQTHTLPGDETALAHLARRLDFDSGADFVSRYEQHSAAIRAVYRRHLEAEGMKLTDSAMPAPNIGRHLARMASSYVEVFDDAEIRQHVEMAERLDADNLVEVAAEPLPDGLWRVTIVAYDYLGELSIICGLLFVYGMNILNGHVFTYEPRAAPETARPPQRRRRRPVPRTTRGAERRKIVDVFTIRPLRDETPADVWARYAADLGSLLRQLHVGERGAARGALARRFAEVVREVTGTLAPLTPVDVEIDNETSDRYTVLWIDAPDTVGFLYEVANALAINRVYISRVDVDTTGQRVHDVLYVTDTQGQKIAAPSKLRELRAAIVLVKHFTHLLPHSPNPEAALLHFRAFLGQLFTRPDWPDELTSLERPEVLDALARLLGVSDFLWEDFLRMQHDNLFPIVADVGGLAAAKPKAQLQAEIAAALKSAEDAAARAAALNAFKDREMFRLDMRYIQGHITEFGQFSGELSDLAEVVVESTYHLALAELRAQFGDPLLEGGAPCPLAVCALGKCGGRELGFASDVELMFIYADNGQTTGPQVISTAEFYERLVQEFVGAIRAKREGIFEVDLQLRPYGSAGSMAVVLESFQRYFAPDGPAWDYERQALVRLRPLVSDPELGRQIVALRDAYVYTGEFDATAMRAMRERQLRHLVTAGTLNVKFSPGGLVDVEYLVQALQITHGHRDPNLRSPSTRAAMAALAEASIISAEDYARLQEAHNFLRQVINALRMVRGHAKDMTVPPKGSEEFAFLARRLRYGSDHARLQADLTRHTANVQAVNARLLG